MLYVAAAITSPKPERVVAVFVGVPVGPTPFITLTGPEIRRYGTVNFSVQVLPVYFQVMGIYRISVDWVPPYLPV